ncbi:MAG: SH3 domain-containing protein [Defluviitaleaceae bacterium]|nr:SH3 domain-containing protein [Defluviitaleaceae bacterium]
MKLLNKCLKICLAFLMLSLSLSTALSVDIETLEVHIDSNDEGYGIDVELDSFGETFYEDEHDFDLFEWDETFYEDEHDFDLFEWDETLYEDEHHFEWGEDDFFLDDDQVRSEQPIPAIETYVPEMLFADDMLLAVSESETFESMMPPRGRSVAAVGSGLVQFVLEPIQSSLPAGVTMAQARAAAFNSIHVYHRFYATETGTNLATGINGSFARDALFLGESANGNRFRVMIAGFEGYVPRVGQQRRITVNVNGTNRTFDVTMNAVFVPFGNYPTVTAGNVQTMSHYVNRNGELFRYLTNNVTTPGGFTRFLTGPAPSWMTQNTRYYSYDGVFFYRNPRNIRPGGSGAVNANNPFFNYFQYLSFRSHSTVTAAELNTFLNNWLHTTNSVMRNQGNAFINAQNHYGINALLMYAKAMHESAGGTSSISMNNNNLFGLGAIDAAPGTNAWHFDSPAASINNLADGWLSRGYLWPGDWRYEGPHAGSKASGMNVWYATDPYWGQKIAGWAFRIDRTRLAANRDFNREQIAIRQNTASVAVTHASGTTLYTANPRQRRYFPFLVIGTASNNRLRVVTDPAITNGVSNRTARFDRSTAIGYIPSNNVWLTGGSGVQASPPPATTHQITTVRETGVTRRTATFRQGPGAHYTSIRSIRGNTNVRVTGRSGEWYRVVIDGTTGWLRRSAVARTRQHAVVTTNNAHVRTGRGGNYSSLTQLPRGHRVIIMRRTENWSRVTTNGHTGWIRNSDLRTGNAMRPGRTRINNVQVHARPRADSEIRHRLPQHTNLMIIQHTYSADGWSQVRISHQGGTLNGWVRSSQVETRAFNRRTNQNGILRSGPGVHFRNLRTVSTNTTVTVRMRAGNWYHIHFYVNGQRIYGWLNRENFSRVTLR